MVPVGDLLPDLPDRGNPGLEKAENVIPLPGAYGPVRDLVSDIASLPRRCRGAGSLVDFDGNVSNFAGDNAELYRRDGTSYVACGKGTDAYDLLN
jgi:hypothetical protein